MGSIIGTVINVSATLISATLISGILSGLVSAQAADALGENP